MLVDLGEDRDDEDEDEEEARGDPCGEVVEVPPEVALAVLGRRSKRKRTAFISSVENGGGGTRLPDF